ncbi:E3 ubiquitin-protein ligase mind-bomb isoform X2 [Aplysia californica]|uniref:E3 ubiquitin-protein ligase mind-bomb isoform X2 n=1 Tax=Aplysia californica TaxID=6500 RepID=A0ABM0K184_APLCA|nr:E3 ubiquitin-protein ligase mind-bomb isoform X2 [Aplysia californica]
MGFPRPECFVCKDELIRGQSFVFLKDPKYILCMVCYDRQYIGGHETFSVYFPQQENVSSGSDVVHTGVQCDACLVNPIRGIRYKCRMCPDFDLCANCKGQGCHSEHNMTEIAVPKTKKENVSSGSDVIHTGIQCDACHVNPIRGIRYKCRECPDFDLCANCKGQGCHSEHNMTEIAVPKTNVERRIDRYDDSVMVRLLQKPCVINGRHSDHTMEEYGPCRENKTDPRFMLTLRNWIQHLQERERYSLGNHDGESEPSEHDHIHFSIRCDACGVCPIRGIRYDCRTCLNIEICADCKALGRHSFHSLREIVTTSAQRERIMHGVGDAMMGASLVNEVSSDGKIHTGIICDVCGMNPIRGIRYKCLDCPNYDLCVSCRVAKHHSHHHTAEIVTPRSPEQRMLDRRRDQAMKLILNARGSSSRRVTTSNSTEAATGATSQSTGPDHHRGANSPKVSDPMKSHFDEVDPEDVKERMTCPVCLDKEKTVAFKCGHCTCWNCSEQLKKCPICKKKITTRIRLFN